MRLAGLFKGSFRRSLIFTFLIAFALLLTYAVLPASAQEGDGMYGGNSAPETHAEHAASLRYAKKVPLATCTEGQLPPGSGEDLGHDRDLPCESRPLQVPQREHL